MLRYFTGRQLSAKFNINLARWKRWSRAFLAPDPLGGLQSGYARQYSIDQAFCVYLGGILVSELKFSIPEAEAILRDLRSWLGAAGLYLNAKPDPELIENQFGSIDRCLILIGGVKADKEGQTLCYSVYGHLQDPPSYNDLKAGTVRGCVFHPIPGLPAVANQDDWIHLRVLNVSNILAAFVSALGIDPKLYPGQLFGK